MHKVQRPTWAMPLLVVLAALAAVAAAVRPAAGGPATRSAIPGTGCGGTLWRQMALNDADRHRVVLKPRTTTLAAIADLKAPRKIGRARTTTFQRHTWHVHAVIDRYRIATNGEIVLILFDIATGRTMNAYLPNPRCLTGKTTARQDIVAARKALTSHCRPATAKWQLLGISTEVTGVGFWNAARDTRGALPNGAELRPVTRFVIDSGCGVG